MKALQGSLAEDGYFAKMLGSDSDFDKVNVLVLPPACDFKGIESKCEGKTVFAPFDANGCINYLKIPYFKQENAVPTAEGAVCTLMNMTEQTVRGMEIGITGAGCIGKELYRILCGLGAYPTLFARGNKKGTRDISQLRGARLDALFNTIPAKIIDYEILRDFPQKPLIIDLASRPGGVDFESAEMLGIRCVHELAIPGRFFPKAAGEILKNTVISYLRGVK